jgi:hypothetical protein
VDQIAGLIFVVILIYLVFQRKFWIFVFFVCGLAAFFAMVASVIHFQIGNAIVFFFVMLVAWGISNEISKY